MTIGKWSDPISQRWIVPRQVILDDQPANEHPRSDHQAVVCYLEEISESRIDIYETKMLRAAPLTRVIVCSFGGVENHQTPRSDRSENCLVRSRGRSLSRHQRLTLTFLRLPSPVHQGQY